MSTVSRYRRELKSWSKNELVREVERLRAITLEHAHALGDDTTTLDASIVDVALDPHARGSVVMDARNAILMDHVDVCLVDSDPSAPHEPERLVVAMMLSGRVNLRDNRSRVMFMFGLDGAAAIVSELLGLAQRIGPDFSEQLNDRLADMP